MHTLRVFGTAPALCLVAGLLLSSACGSSATSPSSTTANLAGTWTGTLTDGISGSGNLELIMSQSGISISGTWVDLFAADPSKNQSGTLTGTISGSSVSIRLNPTGTTMCQGNIVATVTGTSLSGTYSAANCSVTDTGTVSATKK